MAEFEQGLSEVRAPGPVQDEDEAPIAYQRSLEDEVPGRPRSRSWFQFSSHSNITPRGSRVESANRGGHDEDEGEDDGDDGFSDPPGVGNLAETAPLGVVENPSEAHRFSHHNLEEELGQGEEVSNGGAPSSQTKTSKIGRFKAKLFISAHLVVFSILGTLARVGLSMLTTYPTQPVGFTSIWPNFAGTLVLGFLSEGAELFRHPKAVLSLSRRRTTPTVESDSDGNSPSGTEMPDTGGRAKEGRHADVEPSLPVPLHIGLATGFCGSFTSYSAFMRDCFEALAGMSSITGQPPSPGQNFLSVAAVIITTIGLSVVGLKTGAHLAIFLKTYEKKVPKRVLHFIDRVSVVLALLLWSCVVVMAILLSGRTRGQEMWWGQMLLSLAFSPVGCFIRFVSSILLNTRITGFPLGTFCVNMLGTMLLAVVWDLQRLPNRDIAATIGGDLVSCQVLQAVEDGFCGCLTTVSTWAVELSTLRRRHAYKYGFASIATSIVIVIVVMGTLKWTVGLSKPVCVAL